MLQPAMTIDPPEWLISDSAQSLMRLLGGLDEEPKACFVGGCVRNHLMGISVGDFDVATIFTPDVVTMKLEEAGVKVVPTGLEHGTVTAVFHDGAVYEITTLRKDVETDGRRAVVAFSECWREDAQRRDFTINTLLMDGRGCVYDPTEKGISDIGAKRVRFVGDPAERIQEDYLRILRYFRFWALYGQEKLDDSVLYVCGQYGDNLERLSRERITQEMLKIICSNRLADVLVLFNQYKILEVFTDNLSNLKFIEKLTDFQCGLHVDRNEDCLLRLLAFDLSSEGCLETLLSFLRLPKKRERYLQDVARLLDEKRTVDEVTAKEVAYYKGRAVALGWLQCGYGLNEMDMTETERLYHLIEAWDVPPCPVTGRDLIELGYEQGAEMGRKLREIERLWVASAFTLSKKVLLEAVKRGSEL